MSLLVVDWLGEPDEYDVETPPLNDEGPPSVVPLIREMFGNLKPRLFVSHCQPFTRSFLTSVELPATPRREKVVVDLLQGEPR